MQSTQKPPRKTSIQYWIKKSFRYLFHYLFEARSTFISSLIIIIIGLLAGGTFALAAGNDPFTVLYVIIQGGIGSKHGLTETLVKTVPILLAALGVAFAFRTKVWNIGAEGQVQVGIIAAVWVGTFMNLSILGPLHLFFVMLISFVAGGLWGIIPGVLKVKRRVNEILITLLMNYIAFWLLYYVTNFSFLRDWSAIQPRSLTIAASARLPKLISGSRLHVGILLALFLSFLTLYIFEKTRFGFSIKVVGSNPEAAKYAGTNVSKTIMKVFFVSAGLAGLAGMTEVSGLYGYALDPVVLNPQIGYTAIVVALLAGLHPLGIVVVSTLLGILLTGANYMQVVLGVPSSMAMIIEGVILMLVLGREIIAKHLPFSTKETKIAPIKERCE